MAFTCLSSADAVGRTSGRTSRFAAGLQTRLDRLDRRRQDAGPQVCYPDSVRSDHWTLASLLMSAKASLLLLIVAIHPCQGQRYFVSALGGIATISTDATTRLDSPNEVSLYKPENGLALNLAGGIHLNDWFSLQANYVWNRNDLTITEIAGPASFEQDRHSSQHAAIADLLLYFRSRRSRIRPYLSVGSGLVWLRTAAAGPILGTLTPAPPQIDTAKLPLRVAVGIDLLVRHGWGFRYSFSETRTANPISATLEPSGARGLANYQNLFGIVKYF